VIFKVLTKNDKNAAGFVTSHLWLFAFVSMQIAPRGAAAFYSVCTPLTHSYYITLQPVGKYFKHFSQSGGIFETCFASWFLHRQPREKSQLESHLICISFIKKEREFYVNLERAGRVAVQ